MYKFHQIKISHSLMNTTKQIELNCLVLLYKSRFPPNHNWIYHMEHGIEFSKSVAHSMLNAAYNISAMFISKYNWMDCRICYGFRQYLLINM